MEMGTQQDGVDYSWLPKETTTEFSEFFNIFFIFHKSTVFIDAIHCFPSVWTSGPRHFEYM